jgi:hypothetical protein
VVRWIPWKDAGSAYATIQPNPLTGEILRGQIFLPSSWLNPELIGESMSATGLAKGGLGCEVGATAAKDIALLTQTVSKETRQAILDYLRYVAAHESGHTLGMRHHFSAASQVKASFEEIHQATETYRKNPAQQVQYPELSISVMDYMLPLDSAIIGHSLMTRALSYDQDLIEWAYNGKEKLLSTAGAFCTDDHLMYAGEEGLSIMGCGRFQNVGSPLMAQLKAISNRDDASIESDVKTIRNSSISEDGKFKALAVDQYYQGLAAYTISGRTNGLDNLLFSIKNEKDNSEVNLLLLPHEVTKILLKKRFFSGQTSTEVRDKLTEQIKEVTDFPSRLRLILPMDEQGKIDLNWAKNQLEKIDLKKYQQGKTSSGVEYQLSDDEFTQLQAAIQETIRYDERAKLIHSALRLLVDKKGIKSSLMSEKDASEKAVTVSYRDWVANSKIKELLKPYIAQLLTLDLGPKKIADVKGQAVYGKFYVVNKSAFESLQSAVQGSNLILGITLQPIVAQRARDISEVLAAFGFTLNLEASTEEQIKAVDESSYSGQLDFSIAYWAKEEIEFNKALLEQGSL